MRTLFFVLLVMVICAEAAAMADWDVMSDTWVATDALGRSLPTYEQCGPIRQDRTVGIFYFLWHGQHGTQGPYDITKILANNPKDPKWGPELLFHHWGEPELGYYIDPDDYVIRYHARMLANAGVDVNVFDVTNVATYPTVYLRICEIYRQLRSQGVRTPQIAFLTNTESAKVVKQLYDDFYSKGLYHDLWFMWNGKPLMMSRTDGVPKDIQDFFTFRQSWAWTDPKDWFGDGRDKWPWLDHYPQKPGWHDKGVPEQIVVCVGEHPIWNIGRSFHNGREPKTHTPELGLYFAEQWKRGLKVDPRFLFITGWNEWIAMRFIADGKGMKLAGRKLDQGESYFVDLYNQEFSRDAEPMLGGHTDNYYYQMIDGIRRYKGVRKPETASGPKTIRINGMFTDWEGVRPEYRDYIGDTEHRDSTGYGGRKYVNNTGRNDFVRMKVARDARNIYFYAETKDPITEPNDSDWMLLFIDVDQDHSTGWNGYDLKVSNDRLWRWSGLGWDDPVAVKYRVAGNKLEVAVPRAALGLEAGPVAFDFHWADNIPPTADITAFATTGDSAPDRRFNYRYIAD